MSRSKTTILLSALTGGVAAVSAYVFLFRPWHLKWGVEPDELRQPMPLDEAVPSPTYVTNRAVTIHATPGQIWPWLAQMGELPRGGYYSYAWIERSMGMQVDNAEKVLPECQELTVGQRLDHAGSMVVRAFEPSHFLVLGPPEGMQQGDATWCILLQPKEDGTTRLISRVRARISADMRGVFWFGILDPGQFIMERKWLLGVKERAERRAAKPAIAAA